jgi:hypothetical protein
MPSEQFQHSSFPDLRPSRSQVEALLREVTGERATLHALIDAFQAHGLLWGTPNSESPMDRDGRYRRSNIVNALDSFSPTLREQVIAVFDKVRGVA